MRPDRYILWDFDGTLAQCPGGWTGALLEVLQAEQPGHSITRDHLRPFLLTGFRWHRPLATYPPNTPAAQWWSELEPLFERAFHEGGGLPQLQANRLARKVRSTFCNPARWSLFPDTIATLESLAAAGWRHILLTNHVPELPTILQALGIDSHFATIFNSADTGCEKPHPAAFRQVRSSLPPSAKVWMVGDNPVADIQGAETAGIPAILVHKPHPLAFRYAANLADVAAIVESGTIG